MNNLSVLLDVLLDYIKREDTSRYDIYWQLKALKDRIDNGEFDKSTDERLG